MKDNYVNVIVEENRRPGTSSWLLTKPVPRLHGRVRSCAVEGYCSRTSVVAGDTLEFFISAEPAAGCTVDIYRMGYYGGHGGRQLAALGPLPCQPQPEPVVGDERLRECQWSPALALEIPANWPSGVYLGKITEDYCGFQSYVIFVVSDRRAADLLFQCADLTWQAYNHWPDLYSLYTDGYWGWFVGQGVSVSFDRPYGRPLAYAAGPLMIGSGEWFRTEFALAYWLEREGYDVTYASGLDLHEHPERLWRAKGFLSVGHDEYYTLSMYQALNDAVETGLSAAFLGGNSLFGRVELAASALGAPNRRLTRSDLFGPQLDDRFRSMWPEIASFPFESPNASALMGSGISFPILGHGDWTCANADHWIFADAGMATGDSVAGLVGWEFHGTPAEIRGLEVVASAPTTGDEGPGVFASTIYEGESGNLVFNAATIWWSNALAAPPGFVASQDQYAGGPDERVQRITRNVLDRICEATHWCAPEPRQAAGARSFLRGAPVDAH